MPDKVRVYEISGHLFFGAADKILDITLKDYTECLVLRMRAVNAIDATAMNSLETLRKKCSDRGVHLIISHSIAQPLEAMKKSGFFVKVGEENFCAHIDEALEKAEKYTA